MDQSIQVKFDSVLDIVKDPESERPISDLGIVKKFRYSEEGSTIYVFTDYSSHRPACMTCVGISMAIENSVNRALEEELHKHFPDFKIEFVSA